MNPKIDSQGLVSPYPDGRDSNNGIRYSTEWLLGSKLKGGAPGIDVPLTVALRACEHPQRPGTWMRRPDNRGGINSIDDYTSILTFAYYFDEGRIAERIIRRGSKSLWYFNNTSKFSIKGWLGRFPGLIAHAYYCAGKSNPAVRLLWVLTVLVGSFSKSHDGLALTWQMCIVAGGDNWLNKRVSKFFMKKFKALHPDGMRSLMAAYQGWDSPQGKNLSGQFGQPII